MENLRKPFQGVLNIIRFNWHFYALAFVLVSIMLLAANMFGEPIQTLVYILSVLISISVLASLLFSLYVYDLSGLYNLAWVKQNGTEKLIVNINAGFDETSELLKSKFNSTELIALDFYDPKKHTEVSIKRARKAYPPFPNTKQITTNSLPLADNSVDKIFVMLSAHEIRDSPERVAFFIELKRVVKSTGEIYITEHLRDMPNFIAYNIGFFHFYSKHTWVTVFNAAALEIKAEIKLTPFISTFILHKNGNTI